VDETNDAWRLYINGAECKKLTSGTTLKNIREIFFISSIEFLADEVWLLADYLILKCNLTAHENVCAVNTHEESALLTKRWSFCVKLWMWSWWQAVSLETFTCKRKLLHFLYSAQAAQRAQHLISLNSGPYSIEKLRRDKTLRHLFCI